MNSAAGITADGMSAARALPERKRVYSISFCEGVTGFEFQVHGVSGRPPDKRAIAAHLLAAAKELLEGG